MPRRRRAHARQHQAQERDGAEEVHLERVAVVLFLLLLDGADEVDRGVVDEYVDRPEACLGGLDGGRPLPGSLTSSSTAKAVSG